MGDLLLEKALRIRDRIAKLRGALPLVPSGVLADQQLESVISSQLFLLIQDTVDLAVYLVAARGLAVPGSQREALAANTLLHTDTARGMAAMASLRNRLANACGKLDPARMVVELLGASVRNAYVGTRLSTGLAADTRTAASNTSAK